MPGTSPLRRRDEYELQFHDIVEQIQAFVDGKPIHMINPQALHNARS